MGLPEGRFHLALAALYLATAQEVQHGLCLLRRAGAGGEGSRQRRAQPPADASRDSEGFGHGEGYLYPHAYRDHWVAQQYLPTSLQGKVFYQPSDQGYEAQIRAAGGAPPRGAAGGDAGSARSEHGEVLTFSPDDPAASAGSSAPSPARASGWASCATGCSTPAGLPRHGLVLDLKAGSGLLTWEALRRVPEGGVYALARNRRDADALRQLAERLSGPERPIVMEGQLGELPLFLQLVSGQPLPGSGGLPGSLPASIPAFDAIVGHNALIDEAEKGAAFGLLAGLLGPDGVISLAERVPAATQRIYRLVDTGRLGL